MNSWKLRNILPFFNIFKVMDSLFQVRCDGGELKCRWLNCLVENLRLIEAWAVVKHKQAMTTIPLFSYFSFSNAPMEPNPPLTIQFLQWILVVGHIINNCISHFFNKQELVLFILLKKLLQPNRRAFEYKQNLRLSFSIMFWGSITYIVLYMFRGSSSNSLPFLRFDPMETIYSSTQVKSLVVEKPSQ